MALDLRESVAGFKLPEEDMSDARAHAARKAMSTPAMDYDSNTEVIDLDDELLPEDDVYGQPSKA